jgi:hypothetical protein
MFGQAVARDEIVVTGDYPADPSFVHFPGADRLVDDLAIRSFLVAPLSSGGRTFGAMGTFVSRADAFGDKEVALVRALADHAAAAMANADLIKQLGRSRADVERRAETERALREIGGRIIGLRHPEEVLQLSVDEAGPACSARTAPGSTSSTRRPAASTGRTTRRPATGRPRPDRRHRRGEGRRGDLRQGRPRDAAGSSPATTSTTTASITRRPPTPTSGATRSARSSRSADRRAGAAGDAHRLHRRAGRVRRGRRPDHRGARRPGRDRDDERPLIEELDRSREQFSHQADAERALREIAARITAIRDPSDLLQHVVDEAARCSRPSASGST